MKKMCLTFLCTILILAISSHCVQCQVVEHSKEIEKQIDDLFADYDTLNSPGASVAVIKDGEVIYTNGYGSANLEYNIPITPQTIFHAASLSKQFTVFAALLLEERGLLSMDDDVRKYIPEVPDFGKTITLMHLANHSSGLRDQWDLLKMAGWRLDDVITKEHVFSLLKNQDELNFDPGDKNMYCNTGFTLLAEVVSRVSGQSFANFTKENIFKPLNMVNTQFYDDHEKIVKNRAYSYKKVKDGFKKSVLSFANVGATSLFVTAEDFAKWAVNFHEFKIGSKSIIDKMNIAPPLNGETEGKWYALGQFRGKYKGLNVFVHSGSDAGYKAYFARLPDKNISVVVLANVSEINPVNQVFGVVSLYCKNDFNDSSESKKEHFIHDSSIFVQLDKAVLKKYEGEYWELKDWYKRKIYIKNDTLMYFRPNDSETKLLPISDNEFKMIGDSEDVSVIFEATDNDHYTMKLIINDGDPLGYLPITKVKLDEYEGIFYSKELETSYEFKIENNKLFAHHLRLGSIEFESISDDLFISDNYDYKELKFVRNNAGKISGLLFSNGRVKNLKLEKVD